MNRSQLILVICLLAACAPPTPDEEALPPQASPETDSGMWTFDEQHPAYREVGSQEQLDAEIQRRSLEFGAQPGVKDPSERKALSTLTPCSNTTVCTTQTACLKAQATAEGGVSDFYDWYLSKDGGAWIYLFSTSNDYSSGANTVQIPVTASQFGSGSYRVRSIAYIYDFPSDQYFVFDEQTASVSLAFSGSPTAVLKLNQSSSDVVEVCHGYPLTLNGASSICASDYFAGVQLSDAYWGRYGTEYSRWLTSSDYSNYGSISSFNLNGFLGGFGQSFEANQYYRVGLGIGHVWSGQTKLVHVRPSNASLTLNGQSTDEINICQGDPLILDGSASTCVSNYLVGVQLSDPFWGRYGTEYLRWLTAQDFQAYGPINAFNVSNYFAAPPYVQQFQPGQYYRVGLGTGTPWSASTKLVHIIPRPTQPTSPTTLVTINGSERVVTARWSPSIPSNTQYKIIFSVIPPSGWGVSYPSACLTPLNPSQPSASRTVPAGSRVQWKVMACGSNSCGSEYLSSGPYIQLP